MVRGAVFDLDGTLLDSMGIWRGIDIRFLNARGLPIEEDYLRAMNGTSFELGAKYTIERYRLTESPQDLIREWDLLARQTYANDVALKPGACEYLAFLSARGIRMAVATSSYRALFLPTLERHGIERYFEAYITKDEYNRGKDTPEIYLRAARAIDCPPDECIIFEDIFTGVRSARSAGFTVVAVEDASSVHDRNAILREAHLCIKDFTDQAIYALLD